MTSRQRTDLEHVFSVIRARTNAIDPDELKLEKMQDIQFEAEQEEKCEDPRDMSDRSGTYPY